jgi:hypothetical protein
MNRKRLLQPPVILWRRTKKIMGHQGIKNIFKLNVFLGVLGALAVQLMFSTLCFSQTITSDAALVTPLSALGASARADAMGSAFTGVADDPSAVFFNSAGLSGLSNSRLSLNHNSYLGGSFEETFLVGLPAGDLGGFGGAIQYVFWGGLEARDALGVSQGTFEDNDVALSIGWGREWGKSFSLGAALHGTQQKVVNSLYTALSGDVGLLWIPLPDLRLGLVYSGFGTMVAGQTLASDLKGGTSYRIHMGGDKSLLLAFSGFYEPNGVSRLEGGMEGGYRNNLFLRAGYQIPLADNQVGGFDNFTAGAGIHFDAITFDYAYVPYGELGTSHRVSLTYDFPNPTPVPVKPVTVVITPVPTPPPVVTPGPPKASVAVRFEVPLGSATPESNPEILALLEKYEKATEANPKDADAWHLLGLVYWKTGKRALALQCLQKSLRLNPSDLKLKEWLDRYQTSHLQGP